MEDDNYYLVYNVTATFNWCKLLGYASSGNAHVQLEAADARLNSGTQIQLLLIK
jgi:hypothetical protein